MRHANMIRVFNLWMQRYIEDPKKFHDQFQAVTEFLQESSNGKDSTYGEKCVAYMGQLEKELLNVE